LTAWCGFAGRLDFDQRAASLGKSRNPLDRGAGAAFVPPGRRVHCTRRNELPGHVRRPESSGWSCSTQTGKRWGRSRVAAPSFLAAAGSWRATPSKAGNRPSPRAKAVFLGDDRHNRRASRGSAGRIFLVPHITAAQLAMIETIPRYRRPRKRPSQIRAGPASASVMRS